MKKMLSLLTSLILLLAFASPVPAQTKDPWFHLEVRENRDEPELVKVNLPVSMLDVALKIARDKKMYQDRIRLDSHEISVQEMRQIWGELRKAGNAEFVTVEKRNETVRIAREGNFVLVKVFENKNPKVDMRVPVPVVDALLAGSGDELDIKAALVAMQRQKGTGDVLTVNDNKTQVRIWID
jgi:hypothetical protein